MKLADWYKVEGETKPSIDCPLCGGMLLGDSAPHGVKQDGTVYASVVCPCGFHEFVKLNNWTGEIIPHK